MRVRMWAGVVAAAALALVCAVPCWAPYDTRTPGGIDDGAEKARLDFRNKALTARRAKKERAERQPLPARAPIWESEVEGGETTGNEANKQKLPSSSSSPSDLSSVPPAPPVGMTAGTIIMVTLAVAVIVGVLWYQRRH